MTTNYIVRSRKYNYNRKYVPVAPAWGHIKPSYTLSQVSYIKKSNFDSKKIVNRLLKSNIKQVFHVKLGFSKFLDITQLRKAIRSVLNGLEYRKLLGVMVLEPEISFGVHAHLLIAWETPRKALVRLMAGLRATMKGLVAFRVFKNAWRHFKGITRYMLKCRGLTEDEEGDRWGDKRRYFDPRWRFRKVQYFQKIH